MQRDQFGNRLLSTCFKLRMPFCEDWLIIPLTEFLFALKILIGAGLAWTQFVLIYKNPVLSMSVLFDSFVTDYLIHLRYSPKFKPTWRNQKFPNLHEILFGKKYLGSMTYRKWLHLARRLLLLHVINFLWIFHRLTTKWIYLECLFILGLKLSCFIWCNRWTHTLKNSSRRFARTQKFC